MSQVIVAIGNAFDGLRLVGPFDDGEAANQYVEQEDPAENWTLVPLEPPDEQSAAALHGRRRPTGAATFHSINHVDWALLHRQKLVLLNVLDGVDRNSSVAEALWGLVHLLDALQDDAATAGRWTFPGEDAQSRGAQ